MYIFWLEHRKLYDGLDYCTIATGFWLVSNLTLTVKAVAILQRIKLASMKESHE